MKKKILLALIAALIAFIFIGAAFVGSQVVAFNSSVSKRYDVPLPALQASQDPQVLARGQHLAQSIGACLDCHSADLGGKLIADMGPIGVIHGPNISQTPYSDGELARLLRSGVKRDGTSVVFMPIGDFRWWPDADLVAIISWLRTQPAVERASVPSVVKTLGKVLDQRDLVPLDMARRIDHAEPLQMAPPPAATAEYGQFLGRLCMGCHGKTLSGGPIPGAPPELPVPTNITPHESGLKRYSEADFYKTISTGVRPDGSKLNAMMPVATLAAMNDTERKALWLYLQSLPAKPFGER